MTGDWRVEADDEWLAAHSSETFQRLRRRARMLGMVSDAVSSAELGPFGGSPRNPRLRIGGKAYGVVRYARHQITYTTIYVDLDRCRRCGRPLVEVHRMLMLHGDTVRRRVGEVRMCRHCHAGSWLFYSRMPTVRRARAIGRKVVL